MTDPEILQSVLARLSELEAEVRQLRSEKPVGGERGDSAEQHAPLSRRDLLRNIGGAAAAGVGIAAGAAALAPSPAGALTGTWSYGTNTRIEAGADGSGLRSANDSKTLIVENWGTGAAITAEAVSSPAVHAAKGVTARANPGAGAIFSEAAPNGTAIHARVDGGGTGVWSSVAKPSTVSPDRASVHGDAGSNYWGVIGTASEEVGVFGHSQGTPRSDNLASGSGVLGSGAVALHGEPSTGGVSLLLGEGNAPASNKFYRRGSFSFHQTRGLLQCVESGTPGSWVRTGYNPIRPFRLVDSRDSGGPLGPNSHRLFTVAPSGTGDDAIPATATGIILNVTAVGATTSGFLTVFPSDVSVANWPTAGAPYSTVNFAAGQVAANQTTVKIGPDGKIGVFNRNGSVHVVIDVMGYFS